MDARPGTAPVRGLLAAFRFLTRLRLPGPESGPGDLGAAVGWFPLVGACVGLATAAVHAAGLSWWPGPVAAVPALAFGLLLTGGFHEDGATDAADGLGGGWTRERVLEIMRDSRIGAYGAMALWVLLALRWAALAALGRGALVALPVAMAWGRWSIPVMLSALPPVSQGLASGVHQRMSRWALAWASVLAFGVTLAAWRLAGPAWPGGTRLLWLPPVAALVAVGAWIAYLRQRLGGQSGDLLGAGNQLAEAAVLLALLAR
jgi:adenosylcobinamide-GDP ribazoletransferase